MLQPRLRQNRIINVDVSEGESDFLAVAGITRVIFPAGESKVSFEVPIERDEIDEPDGLITATILPGLDYEVSSTQNSASVKVIDDDGTPGCLSLASATD